MAAVADENPNAPRLGDDDGGGIRPASRGESGEGVMLEVPARPGMSPKDALEEARRLPNFVVDEDFEPVPMGEGTDHATYVVRGMVEGGAEPPTSRGVVGVWRDTPVAPFGPEPDE